MAQADALAVLGWLCLRQSLQPDWYQHPSAS